MILTSGLLNDLFDDSFAIRRMNEIIKQKEITHDDNGATIKLKVPGFNKKSVSGGKSICMKQTWNQECHTKYKSIDRLSDLITIL